MGAAIAAMVIVALGALLWQANARLSEPRVIWEEQVLFPEGRRGPAEPPTTVTVRGDSLLLVVPLMGTRDFPRYRLEISESASSRPIWRSTAPHPGESNSFVIVVPRQFLKPGTYRLAVYGLADSSEALLTTYSLRVPR